MAASDRRRGRRKGRAAVPGRRSRSVPRRLEDSVEMTATPESHTATRREGVPALLEAARAVRERAHAPYSRFQVGAALECRDGEVIVGCNVENATYGLTMCAERVAVFRAIADGHRAFERVVIVTDTAEPTPPCGACRQLLWELCGDIEVVLANLSDVTARYRLSQLFPVPFDRRFL